jgi:hypothetical protein
VYTLWAWSSCSFNFMGWVGVGFEFRASCLQNRCSTLWVSPPVHIALFILELGVSRTICLGCPQIGILPISASQVSGIIGMSHQHPASFNFNVITHTSPPLQRPPTFDIFLPKPNFPPIISQPQFLENSCLCSPLCHGEALTLEDDKAVPSGHSIGYGEPPDHH